MFGILKTWKDYKEEAGMWRIRYELRVQMYKELEEEAQQLKKENDAMRRIICTVSDEKLSKIKE